MSKMTPGDIEVLVQLFDASDWGELELQIDGTEVFLSKNPLSHAPEQSAAPRQSASATAPASAGTKAAYPPQSTRAPDNPVPVGWTVVKAPSLGTFYRAPKPGAPPYVESGQSVTRATEVCLIEVMKLFTTVRADIEGTVRQICVTDGQLVEYDQPLFFIEPHA